MLETDRLYLREFIPDDAIHLFEMNDDPEVLKYTGDLPFINLEDAERFIKNYITDVYTEYSPPTKTGLGRFAVIRKQDNEFLGWCGLKFHPEERVIDVGYRFYRCYWNNGYATESAKATINYAFIQLKLPKIVAHAHINNIDSHKVLEKCGMTRVSEIQYDDQPTLLYRLDNQDFQLREIDATETWPVRHPVLRTGRPIEDVYMEADEMQSTFHLGMFYKDKIVGVASFMEDSHPEFSGIQSRLRGMAVLPEFRKRGIAELLLKKGEDLLKERKRTVLWFNARINAVNFYKNLDYQIIGDAFDIPKVGPHFRMKKEL